MSDEADQKDYQDYLEYQKHISAPQSGPTYKNSAGETNPIPTVNSIMTDDKARGGNLAKITNGIASGGVGEVAAPLGGLLSSAGKGISNFFKPAVARSAAMGLVKNEAALGPSVATKIGEATDQFNKTQIAPRMAEQYTRAGEQAVPFNPDAFKGIHPSIDEMVNNISQGGVKEIPMKDALDLRAALNNKSMFKDMGPYSEEIAARSQKAVDAGNSIRQSINTVDPNIGAISGELQDAYSLRKAVTKGAAKRPISTVEAPVGSDKASLLSQFDNAAGTDLRQYGQNITKAKSQLGQSQGAWSPGSVAAIANRVAGVAPRAYDSLATMLQPAAETVGNAAQSPVASRSAQIALQALIQGKNRQ